VIVNQSTGALTVNSSGGNLIKTVAAGTTETIQCILLTGTSAASWNVLPDPSALHGDGTVALPSVSFVNDTDTGMYRIGANNIGVAANGAKVLDVSTTGLGVVGTILNSTGTVSLPAFSFTADPDTGWYRIGANNAGFAADGAKVLDVSTTGLAVTGTLSATSTFSAVDTSTLTSAADTAAEGPVFYLSRNSASPAAADNLGTNYFSGKNSSAATVNYAFVRAIIGDATAGSVDGILSLGTAVNNAETVNLYLGANAAGTFAAGVIGVPNGKLSFPAVQSASSDANTLDDYEEGSWTPSMTFNAATTGITYGAQYGSYVKTGQDVISSGRVTLTSNGSEVGVARVASMPFTVSTTHNWVGTCRVLAGGSAVTGIKPNAQQAATVAVLYIPGAVSDAAASDTNCTDTFSTDLTMPFQASA
jgi:hypothetical protein